jgi:NADH-quinone oxidoreductase subunit G
VIVYGDRVLADTSGPEALIALVDALGIRDRDGAGLLGIPAFTNTRGLTEIGFHPLDGKGGLNTGKMRDAKLSAYWLHAIDPVTELPNREKWDAALGGANVVAHAKFLTDGLLEHAQVVFPLEAAAEREGTLTHFDGRLQRLRQAISRPGEVRPGWQVFADLGKRLGIDIGVFAGPIVSKQVFDAIPFYGDVTLDEIGGKGTRWPERKAASKWPQKKLGAPGATKAMPAANGKLRLGTYSSVWDAPEVSASPALSFLTPTAKVELSPADAERLELVNGQRALVGGAEATVVLRDAVPKGSVFLEGNKVADGLVEVKPA